MPIDSLYTCFSNWAKQGTIWIYSDPHFSDTDLQSQIKNRPTDEEQIKLINSKVGRKDTLIILGDIGNLDCMNRLRGYKVLIAGNHDTGLSKYKEVFNEIYEGPVFITKNILLSHEPIDLPFIFNIHGHVHNKIKEKNNQLNVCADIINYTPINFNQLIKSGCCSKIQNIHRVTINNAIKRKNAKENNI